jgi:GNAT superfamily N-acetyltransferase
VSFGFHPRLLAAKPEFDHIRRIEFLVISEDVQGKRIGAALVDAADRELVERGVHDRFVGAIEPNQGAIRFYGSRGFRPAWLELTKF